MLQHILNSFLWPNNILSYGNIISFICLSVDSHLGYFYFGGIINNAAINIHVQVMVWPNIFISLGYIPRNRMLGYMVTLCLNLKKIFILKNFIGI